MSSSEFRFKQFAVGQSRSAMKVGTDGVLLGAWFDAGAGPVSILDVGCGTGLISLMAAQRNSSAIVDAIDIDGNSCADAQFNAGLSPWPGRIRVMNLSLQEHSMNYGGKYGRIVSNPPYFVDSLKSPDGGRTAARHTVSLSFDELAAGVARLLAPDGLFAVILPLAEAERFSISAAHCGLNPCRVLRVRTSPAGKVKRVMTEYSFGVADITQQELTVETGEAGIFTTEYRELTKDFYLKF